VSPEDAQVLAIALHELATNAAKYGSLSRPEGRVEVSWNLTEGGLELLWAETGGPAVSFPKTQGFGTKIITASLADPRRGSVAFDWRREGLSCALTLKSAGDRHTEAGPKRRGVDRAGPPSTARRLLLVEDEVIVGILMREMLEDMGFSVGEPCRTLGDALAAARDEVFDGAILDMNLNGVAVYPLADLLTAQNVPFVFVTGYSADAVDGRFAKVPVVQKPVTSEALAEVIHSCVRAAGRAAASSSRATPAMSPERAADIGLGAP